MRLYLGVGKTHQSQQPRPHSSSHPRPAYARPAGFTPASPAPALSLCPLPTALASCLQQPPQFPNAFPRVGQRPDGSSGFHSPGLLPSSASGLGEGALPCSHLPGKGQLVRGSGWAPSPAWFGRSHSEVLGMHETVLAAGGVGVQESGSGSHARGVRG